MKKEPSLLLDIGNSRLKWGVCRDGNITRTGSVKHEKLHESGFSSLTKALSGDVDEIICSNVAGSAIASRLSAFTNLQFGRGIRFVHSEANAFGVRNSYKSPRSLGVDRWVGMVGAYSEFRSALCVVDAGTAVTIDALDRGGQHLGGQIIPGLAAMAACLPSNTAGINHSGRPVRMPGSGIQMFASSTHNAIAYGAFGAVTGAIEHAIRGFRSDGYRPKIILTGGDASRILKHLDAKCLHRPNLVLQGLARMLESNL